MALIDPPPAQVLEGLEVAICALVLLEEEGAPLRTFPATKGFDENAKTKPCRLGQSTSLLMEVDSPFPHHRHVKLIHKLVHKLIGNFISSPDARPTLVTVKPPTLSQNPPFHRSQIVTFRIRLFSAIDPLVGVPDQEESSEEEDNTGKDQRTRAANTRKFYERSVRKSPFKNRLWTFEAPDSAAQLSVSEFIPQLQLIADACLYKLQYKEGDSESKKQYN